MFLYSVYETFYSLASTGRCSAWDLFIWSRHPLSITITTQALAAFSLSQIFLIVTTSRRYVKHAKIYREIVLLISQASDVDSTKMSIAII